MSHYLDLCRILIGHSYPLNLDECRIGEDMGIGQDSVTFNDASRPAEALLFHQKKQPVPFF
jgi:hypothetical protein